MKLKTIFIHSPLLLLVLVASAAPAADATTVTLVVEEGGFSPAEVQAPAGARLRLEVTNHTAAAMEFESFDLNRERVVQPGQVVAVYLSGLAPGRYEFFDDFHHGRRGVLVIR
jgi:plastocyanin